jgi:hypothetical protein
MFSYLGYIGPNIKEKNKKNKKFKFKISESFTLSLQGMLENIIDIVYYGTLHIL